jgi:hypothetical protein
MPYYKNLHLLYVHIPKTGGTSVEDYLVEKCGGQQTLRNPKPAAHGNNVLPGALAKVSLQHQTLATLESHGDVLGIDFRNPLLRTFATVRNPYDRAISDLFWYKLIERASAPDAVFRALKEVYLPHPERWDNHSLPQHRFIASRNARGQLTLRPGVTVLKCESLTADMRQMGFDDYTGPDASPTYDKYLNSDSTALINQFYAADFALLGYQMR